jgi:hypothetical protein
MTNQRREFLKVSALAGGAALSTPFISNQAEAATAGPGAGAEEKRAVPATRFR